VHEEKVQWSSGPVQSGQTGLIADSLRGALSRRWRGKLFFPFAERTILCSTPESVDANDARDIVTHLSFVRRPNSESNGVVILKRIMNGNLALEET
jgi:hypothetical protein